MHVVIDTSSHW